LRRPRRFHCLAKRERSSLVSRYDYDVGTPNGTNLIINTMQLQVEKYISLPQSTGILPSRVAVFFDLTNQFNSISRKAFFKVIADSFPEIPPLITLFESSRNKQGLPTTNGQMAHGAPSSSWRRAAAKAAHSPPFLPPSVLDLRNPKAYYWHHSPGLISGFSGGKKKSQNKNFDDHITTI